jgi:RNA polymerase sigma factor (sigma-70 family)
MYAHTLARRMSPERGRHRFVTTRWSLVIAAAGVSPRASTALAELCDAYWYPAYAYTRRSGYSVDDAADLTQAFFTRVLEKQFLKEARPERGRFRSFLLVSLRHFISNERDWKNARKRGGNVAHVPIDFGVGEDRYQREPADDLTPERIYERRWTLDVIDRAMGRLSAKYATTGRHALFAMLTPHLIGDEPESYAVLAASAGLTEGTLRQAVHRLRREFRATLRDTIAETVERAEDVADELRYLLRVIAREP